MRALPLVLALSAVPAVAQSAAPSAPVGTWRVMAPTATKGRTPEIGELKVDAAGNYQWSENKQLAGLGTLAPRRPNGGARSGEACWGFHRGKGDLYAFQDGDTLEIYDAASNTLLGKAAKTATRRR
ncbi:MAG: hypothetical protein JST05_03705 [Acidobacteria bacterium]|nr:hypothetical protein [Acidobacteriota bacterium]